MTDPVQALLQAGLVDASRFPETSRYHGVPTAKLVLPDGRQVRYLRRRFVPQPTRFAEVQVHRVTQGDRLDNLAARYLGDPEQFGLLCDANGAMRPAELVETIGRALRITLPEGVPDSDGGPA